tara:strand:- start:480 stop:623 length:144 start_codon:yes stop_codon:yes gene_type:complete
MPIILIHLLGSGVKLAVSTIGYLTFPVSLIVSYIAFGRLLTEQLLIA